MISSQPHIHAVASPVCTVGPNEPEANNHATNPHSVIVTGGCGCLGQHLVRELILMNKSLSLDIQHIIILDTRPWDPFWHLFTSNTPDDQSTLNNETNGPLQEAKKDKFPSAEEEERMVRWFKVDLCDDHAVKDLFKHLVEKFENISTVFHTMSTTLMWAPHMAYFDNVNVKVTRLLLDIAQEHDCIKNFIYTSSGVIFWRPGMDETTDLKEDTVQTVIRDENGHVIGVELNFNRDIPEKTDYGYVLSKQEATRMVSERAFSQKNLNTMSLAVTTNLYGEAENHSLTTTFVKYGGMVSLGMIFNSIYAGNAALGHVLAMKAMMDPEKAPKLRGMVYIISDNTHSNHLECVREVLKRVTGDFEGYAEHNTTKLPIVVLSMMNYWYKLYNNSVHMLSSCYEGAKQWFTTPLSTDFLMQWTYKKGKYISKGELAREELSYYEKYQAEECYQDVASYLLRLEELGKIKIYRDR